jgi:cellulose synthase/poly-beta-1,6-N-acetylglucosamine synthase-like glycosyltransferase
MISILTTVPFCALFWMSFDAYFLVNHLVLRLRKKSVFKWPTPDIDKYNPLMTLVIPAYNNLETLKKNILCKIKKELSEQDRLSFDVIVVDSSTDSQEDTILDPLNLKWEKTDEKCKVARIKNLTLIHLKNRKGGKAWAINTISSLLRTQYFAILDSDWPYSTHEFSKALQFLNANSQFSYLQLSWWPKKGKYNFIEGLDQISINYRHQFENRIRILKNIPITIHGSAVIIKTLDFKEMGGFDETVLSEDVDLAIRFLLKGKTGTGIYDLGMCPNPCNRLKQFFWQKARWAQGRSQMLSKYALKIILSKEMTPIVKLFWLYYLSYFGRCVVFSITLAILFVSLARDSFEAKWVSIIFILSTLILRYLSQIFMTDEDKELPFLSRLLEPFSFYGIGLIYTVTFFQGLLYMKGKWRVENSIVMDFK